MSCHKKVTDEEKIMLVNEYVLTRRNGDPSNVSFTGLAKYANEKGFPLKEYDFRRCERVTEHLDNLRQGTVKIGNVPILTPYQPVKNIRSLAYSMNGNPEKLRCYLEDMDKKLLQYSDKVVHLQGQLSACQMDKTRLEQEKIMLEQRAAKAEGDLNSVRLESPSADSLRRDKERLIEQLKQYKKFISQYVMDDIAAQLFEKVTGQHISDESVLNMNALNTMIDDELPKPVCIDTSHSNNETRDSIPNSCEAPLDDNPILRLINDMNTKSTEAMNGDEN